MGETSTIRILGIDPGFDRLGVCVLDKTNTEEKLIHSACILSNKKDSFEKRLVQVGKELEEVIKKFKPSELAIETIFLTKNQKTVVSVAEIRGVCIYLSHTHGIRIYEYSPPQIKMAIAGYGRATKEDLSYMVPKILKIRLNTKMIDDELDAIAIALTHSAHRKIHGWK